MASQGRILIVEDDLRIVELLKLGLRQENFDVYVAADGPVALELFQSCHPDIVILDLLLPTLPGGDVCKSLRAQSDTPILVLTACDDLSDKLSLFRLGADDYIVKPFNFDELLARIRVALRRHGKTSDVQELTFVDMSMRPDTREVSRAGSPIELTAKEFDLLHLFMSNPRTVLAKGTILNQVWGYQYMGDSNIVEVYVAQLRKKLGEPAIIHTVRGVGYSLRALP